jgi:hypothetical protein
MAGQKREARLHADVPAVDVLLPSFVQAVDGSIPWSLRCLRKLHSLRLLFPE